MCALRFCRLAPIHDDAKTFYIPNPPSKLQIPRTPLSQTTIFVLCYASLNFALLDHFVIQIQFFPQYPNAHDESLPLHLMTNLFPSLKYEPAIQLDVFFVIYCINLVNPLMSTEWTANNFSSVQIIIENGMPSYSNSKGILFLSYSSCWILWQQLNLCFIRRK